MIVVFFACLALQVENAFSLPKFDWTGTKYVYAFGDSYSYVVGTAGSPRGNLTFIGDAFDFAFTAEKLLTNEIIVNKTSSGYVNWLQSLTGCSSGLPSKCQRQLWDFAFAGATIDARILPLHREFTNNLIDQVRQWSLYAKNVIPHPAAQTLTTWWIGINDCVDASTKQSHNIHDFDAFLSTEMDSYFKAVQMAYDSGLRQHLFMNVPPMERAPAFLSNATALVPLKDNVNKFNRALVERAQIFAATNPDAIVMNFDVHTLFNHIMDQGEYTDISSYCTCDTPGYFWWNDEHPTWNVHVMIANALEEFFL